MITEERIDQPLVPHEQVVGRTVVLEPLEPSHTPALITAALEGQSMFERFKTTDMTTEADVREWASAELRRSHMSSDAPFTVSDVATGSVIGCVWVMDVREPHGRARIGQLWFRPETTPHDQRIEALLLIAGQVMGTQRIDRISLRVPAYDADLEQVLDALGATREGVLRDWLRRSDGSREDVIVFSLLEREWPECVAGAIERIGGQISREDRRTALAHLQTVRGESVELPLPRS